MSDDLDLPMVARVRDWLRAGDGPRLTVAQAAVLMQLAWDAGRGDVAWSGRADLATTTCMSERGVTRATSDLVVLGVLERLGGGHRGRRTEYRILVAKGDAGVTQSPEERETPASPNPPRKGDSSGGKGDRNDRKGDAGVPPLIKSFSEPQSELKDDDATTDCAPGGAPSAADDNPAAAALVATHGLDRTSAEKTAAAILAKATGPVRNPAAYVLAAYVPPKTASSNGNGSASPRRPGTRTCPVCRHPVAADGSCDCPPGGQTFTVRVVEPDR